MANIAFIEDHEKRYISLDDLSVFLKSLKPTAYWKTGEQVLNEVVGVVDKLNPVSLEVPIAQR